MKILKISIITLVVACFSLPGMAASSSTEEGMSHHPKHKRFFRVRCQSVNLLDAHLAMLPPIGPASGPANFVIGGFPMPATATVELLGPPILQDDGTRNILVQLQYDFGGGDVLFAFARGVLFETERLGVFDNLASINYVGGTGRYRRAYGRFDASGVLNFADFEVDMIGRGEVCNLAR